MSRIECEARVSLWFVLITALTVNVNNHQQPNPWVPVERSSGEPPALPYVLIMLRCWDVVVSLLWCLFDASETFSLDSTSHTSVTSSHNAIIKNDTTVHVRYIELIASFCIKISLYYIFWLPCNRFCNRKAKRQKTIQEVELIQVTVSDDG